MDTSNNDYYQPTGTQSSQPTDDASSTSSTDSGQAGQAGTGQENSSNNSTQPPVASNQNVDEDAGALTQDGIGGVTPSDPPISDGVEEPTSSGPISAESIPEPAMPFDDASSTELPQQDSGQVGTGQDRPDSPVAEPVSQTAESINGTADTGEKEEESIPAGIVEDPKDVYNNFVDRLVQEFGYSDLPENEKAQLVDAMKERIETRVLQTLMTSLTKEQSDEMDREVKEKGLSEEAIIDLLSKKAPNASTAILSALDDLYLEMKEENDVIQKAALAQAQDE